MAGMTPAAVGDLIEAGDPRVAPDGRTAAFVVTWVDLEANEYRSRVWLAAVDGATDPRPFSGGPRRDRCPRWAPDGRSLAFLSQREEHGSQLLVAPVEGGGEVRQVASWPEAIEELAWSPDGRWLAFVARRRDEEQYGPEHDRDRPPRRITRLVYRLDDVGWTADRPRHLFVVPADGSAPPRDLTEGEWSVGGLAWSPDGTAIAFSSARHDDWDLDRAVDLFRVDLDGGPVERLTETGVVHWRPSWSSDGGQIAFVWEGPPLDFPHHSQIGVIPDRGGEPRLLTTSLDRQCLPHASNREPIWAGEDLLFAIEDGGDVHLYRVAADGSSAPERVVAGTREITGWDAAAGVVAFTASSPTEPAELFVLDGAGEERRLTDVGGRFRRRYDLAAPERFTAVSPDGAEVDAWIVRPVDFDPDRRYPALLNIHGGPFTQYANHLFDEFQVQAEAGYVVLYSNPRGSSGYAEAWGRAIRGPNAPDPGSGWGGVDHDDVMAVLDTALKRFDFIDADRLGVLGGSYGGFMTSWIVAHTDRFRAACSERAVNNRYTSSWTSDIGPWFSAYLGVTHLDDPDEYLRQSPITFADRITTPLLILHSENDLRCPIEQAEQLFVALRMRGREVEFVRFPGEGHELSRSGSPRHRQQRFEIILDFFARHLGPSG